MSSTTPASASEAVESPFGQRPSFPFDLDALGSEWRKVESKGRTFAVLDREIEKSPNDSRAYRLITLSNGLKAILVSDPSTDKAAASLSVGVGHLSDPDDLPGLAHFCEHMLFLGTTKYPQEDAYKRFLSEHNGSSNAYTSLNETNYHFECSPNGIPGALSRHSQFFTSPLFLPSCTEREVNAVDSEFRRNLQLDTRRLFQLGKATSAKEGESVYWKFGTGSLQTLWSEPVARGEDVRARLLAWYSKEYSSNLMTLSVISSHSLDELTDLVVAEYEAIPNLNLKPNVFDAPTLSDAELGKLVSYRTVKDSPSLRIEFPLPDLSKLWATKPGRFLGHYVGHEGPGSILAELKAKGWATSLSAGASNGAAGFDFFRVNINLTASGFKHYNDVLQITYAYIDLLKSTLPQEWAFAENRQIGEVGWRWKENGSPSNLVKSLSSRLNETEAPLDRLLVQPWFATTFDAEIIKTLLDRLSVKSSRVLMGSKDPVEGKEFWTEKEQYYSTEYDIAPLDVAHLEARPPTKLSLPEPNIFIPTHLELLSTSPAAEPSKRPTVIRQNSTTRLFHKADDTWCVPRASAYFLLRSPLADKSPADAMKAQLFASLVEESLAEYSYDATLAGLQYDIGNEVDGLQLIVTGYSSSKLNVLLSVVLDKLKSFEVDTDRFALVHDRLRRAYQNASLNNPSTLADSHLRHLTRQTHWTFEERLAALETIEPKDVQEQVAPLLASLQIEALVHGNLTKEDAVTLVKLVETKLSAQPANHADNDYHRALVLPSASNLVFRPPVPSAENVNSAASVFYQVGPTSDHQLGVQLALFAQIAKVPVFSTLRTKEQLGYIVSSSSWVVNSYSGFRVIVQSERIAEYLEERIEALWEGFESYLQEMSEEDFGKQKESLISKRKEKAKNLAQETSRYWREIESGELDFFYREREAVAIGQLNKDDLIAFFNTFINPASPSRTKLSILMRSQRFQPLALEPLAAVLPSTPEVATLVAGKPTLNEVRTFVDKLFPNGVPSEVENTVSQLSKLPELKKGVREIVENEVEEFRKTLPLGPPVVAVDDFKSDLAVARL